MALARLTNATLEEVVRSKGFEAFIWDYLRPSEQHDLVNEWSQRFIDGATVYHYGNLVRFGVPLLTSILDGFGIGAVANREGNLLMGYFHHEDEEEDISNMEREERDRERERQRSLELTGNQFEMETELVEVRTPAFDW